MRFITNVTPQDPRMQTAVAEANAEAGTNIVYVNRPATAHEAATNDDLDDLEHYDPSPNQGSLFYADDADPTADLSHFWRAFKEARRRHGLPTPN